MNEKINFILDSKMIESLQEYSEILKRPPEIILKEALEEYFIKIEKELLEKAMADENAITNLSYDEFWDGVEID
jgi:predicted transcriptional regulator